MAWELNITAGVNQIPEYKSLKIFRDSVGQVSLPTGEADAYAFW